LYVRTLGPDGAPSILFLHGGGVSGWMWEPVASRLATDYHCLIPDLPDHGRSLASGPFAIAAAVEYVAALVRAQAHGGRAHVVGISLGAQVGLHLLATDPRVVESAVLSGTLVRSSPGARLATLLMRLYAPVRGVPLLVRANMRVLGIPNEYLPRVREDTRLLTVEHLGRILAANQAYRVPSRFESDARVLLILSEREPRVVGESARDLLAALPRGAARVVPGLGHAWVLQAPGLCARTISAWLRGEALPAELLPLG
jgi:pimeloyl-ACP methyl ester carboxylesterase